MTHSIFRIGYHCPRIRMPWSMYSKPTVYGSPRSASARLISA
ncbi:MAG: hypothetical protein ACYTFI_28740 [Planctomycetota bacterium]